MSRQPEGARLAVIVPSYDSPAVLRRTLAALLEQPEVAEVVVSDCSPQAPPAVGAEDRDRLQILRFSEPRPVPALRWAALPLTSAPLIGALEARCVPAPDWARRIIAAHQANPGCPAIGGPVAPGAAASAFELGLYLCEYAAFAPPAAEGPARALSGANLCYKRRDLEEERDYLDSGRWETVLHERWLAQGRELRLCGAKVDFHNTMTPATALAQRYYYGRGYAAERLEAQPRRRAWLLAAGCPGLPLLLTLRTARAAARRGLGGRFARALAWVIALHAAWSAGELAGYLRGRDQRPRIF